MSKSVLERLKTLFESREIVFSILRHEPVYTSEEAAAVRGAALSSGAKALICKGEKQFVMFVLPADCKLDCTRVRKVYVWRKLRFADRKELLGLTGLNPGSIPPFGSLFGLSTYCDEKLSANATINFNIGDNAVSANIRFKDYIKIEQPEVGNFSE